MPQIALSLKYCSTVPTGAPTSLVAVQATTNSLTLSWDPPPFDQQNGLIRYYIINITDVTNGSSFEMTTNTTRTTIFNLRPFFTYNCSVAAFTVDKGPISTHVVVTLPQAGQFTIEWSILRSKLLCKTF